MDATDRRVRIGIYGTGNFANRTHLPNLSRIAGANIVAASDPNPKNLAATADEVVNIVHPKLDAVVARLAGEFDFTNQRLRLDRAGV